MAGPVSPIDCSTYTLECDKLVDICRGDVLLYRAICVRARSKALPRVCVSVSIEVECLEVGSRGLGRSRWSVGEGDGVVAAGQYTPPVYSPSSCKLARIVHGPVPTFTRRNGHVLNRIRQARVKLDISRHVPDHHRSLS